MKKPKVYLIVMLSLLAAAFLSLIYVWLTIQFFHTKTKEASRDAYAPLDGALPVVEDSDVNRDTIEKQ